MSLYVWYDNEDEEVNSKSDSDSETVKPTVNQQVQYYVDVPSCFQEFFGGWSYNSLYSIPNVDYERNSGPQSLLEYPHSERRTTDNSYPHTEGETMRMGWEYRFTGHGHYPSQQLTDQQMRAMYFESEGARNVFDRVNLYDFIGFLRFYDNWRQRQLAVTWHYVNDPHDTVDDSNLMTAIMTAEDLLLYGLVWSANGGGSFTTSRTYSEVENYTLWDTFYDTINYIKGEEFMLDDYLDRTDVELQEPKLPLVVVESLADIVGTKLTLGDEQEFQTHSVFQPQKNEKSPQVMLRLYPSVYYQVYQPKEYRPGRH